MNWKVTHLIIHITTSAEQTEPHVVVNLLLPVQFRVCRGVLSPQLDRIHHIATQPSHQRIQINVLAEFLVALDKGV